MSRYPRLLVGLAVLALAYWGLGGFGQEESVPEERPAVEDQADSTLETSEAIGGPDDGISLGLSPRVTTRRSSSRPRTGTR